MKKNKQDSSWLNYKNYSKGKERLKHGILQHPDESPDNNSVYNFIKNKINKGRWIMPFNQYEKMGKVSKSKK